MRNRAVVAGLGCCMPGVVVWMAVLDVSNIETSILKTQQHIP